MRLGNDDLKIERDTTKYKNTDVDDDLVWIGLLKIPGKGDVLLTGDITELSIDSPPVSMIQSVSLQVYGVYQTTIAWDVGKH